MSRKLAIGVATTAAAMAFAAPAFADTTPIPLSFNNLILDTPATGKAPVVSPSTAPLTVTAQVDTTTGDFTIDPTTFSAPTYAFSQPVSGTLALTLASPASGNVNFATGAVTLTGDFLSTITIPSLGGSCMIDTGTLNLSTATTQPLPGTAFPAGATGVATGTGAFGAGWSSLNPGTGAACPTIDSFVDNGAGGIWVSRGISPAAAAPKAPKLSTKATKPTSVKAGSTATVKVTLANTGGADTKSVKVCLVAKKPLTTTKCQTIKDPGAGVKKNLVFKVKTTKTTLVGNHLLSLTATGAKPVSLTLKVAK